MRIIFGRCVLSILLVAFTPIYSQVVPGIDVLKKHEFREISGKKVGLITNQTGVSRDGRRSIDVLFQTPNVDLVAIFSPEHGVFGTADQETLTDAVDSATRVPVYSLYGKTRRLTDRMLKGVDVLIYDIQDVGVRFYTYITTMGYAMEEAARRGMKFVILDRPVMINGSSVEGDLPGDSTQKWLAYYPIPTRYGMTVGELAHYYNEEKSLSCDLEVVKMEGWKRTMWYDETSLPWVNPSPNIRRLDQAILYSGFGCFEYTNLSVGRGTDRPFEYYGAPYLDGEGLAKVLNEKKIPGIKFSPVSFTPKERTFQGEECHGVKVEITDRDQLRTTDAFVHMAVALKNLTPKWSYRLNLFSELVGSSFIIDALDRGIAAEEILNSFYEKVNRFQEVRKKYLLY